MAGSTVVEVFPGHLSGTIPAIASKSAAHRALICAALADAPCLVACATTSQDIDATAACLRALGAGVTRTPEGFAVTPVPRAADGTLAPEARGRTLDCGESGSTLRFMLPVCLALQADATLTGHGRLPERPLSPLREELEAHGCVLSAAGEWPLRTSGRLEPGTFSFAGDVSSQFTTGLLLALPLLGEPSHVELTPPVESRPYIDMTLGALASFGACVACGADGRSWDVTPRRLASPGRVEVEADWSNAAFWLAAGALGADVALTGLSCASAQGDRGVCDVLERFGAHVIWDASGAVRAQAPAGALHACEIDASDIPDLVPVLSVVAACAHGVTRVTGAARLRLKESDRLTSTSEMLCALGVTVVELPDGLEIYGCAPSALDPGMCLASACVSSANDHRLAMSAAVAALRAKGPVTIAGAQAVNKSYPAFFDDWRALGGRAEGSR